MPAAVHRCLCFSFLVFFLTSFPADAQYDDKVSAEDDTIWVSSGKTAETIPFSLLYANDTTSPGTLISIARNPVHGALNVDGSSFVFSPDDNFRSLRHDSFAYTVLAPGGSTSTATVHLLRKVPDQVEAFQGFENNESTNYDPGPEYLNNIFISSAAALVGSHGLRVIGDGEQQDPAYISFIRSDTGDDGGTTLLGCGLANIPEGRGVILALGFPGQDIDDVAARVVIEHLLFQTPRLSVEVRRADGLGYTSSDSLEVRSEVVEIELEWFRSGLTLDVDGRAVSNLDPANTSLSFSEVQVGLVSTSGMTGSFHLDFDQIDFRVHSEDRHTPLLLTDNFEPDLSFPWVESVGSGVSESILSPITGARSLRVNLGYGNGFLLGTVGSPRNRLGVRFRLDASAVDLAKESSIRLLDLGMGWAHDSVSPLRSIVLSNQPGTLTLTTTSSYEQGDTPVVGINSAEVHTISLQYRKAASTSGRNGYFRMWVDGNIAIESLDLDNFDFAPSWLRLGSQGHGPRTSGILVFDDFESWR